MKRILVSMLLAAGCWLALAGAALGAPLADVVRTLETPFQTGAPAKAAIRDFEADFFQESRIASLDRIQRGRGRVAVRFERRDGARPPLAMFRWEYEQPTNQEIVSDGRTMWVYLPENRQVIVSDIDLVNRTDANDPLTFLTGLGNLSRDFYIRWAEPNRDVEGNWILELTPNRTSPLITRLLMVVNRRAVESFTRTGSTGEYLPILASTVFDPNGNSTRIEFEDIRVNRGLSAGYFDFILPGGVDVVRPTGQGMGF